MNRSTCDASRRYRSSVIRSFVRSSRSFVARAPGARACRRFRDDSPETRSIDRSSLARVSRSVDAIAIDDATIHIFILHSPVSRARPPPRPSRASLARDRTHLRATRRRDAMMIERVHRRSSRRTQHGARRSYASKKTPRFFSRSSFALPRRVARRRVAFDRSDRSNRIESRRGVDSSRVVRILES